MLSNVSWSEFGAVLGVLLVLYYLFVGAKYYHKDIKDVLAGKAFKKKESTPKNFPERFMNDTPPADNSIDELETIVNDLRYAVLDKGGKSVTKQELLNGLRNRLVSYEGIHKPPFRVAINNYIIRYAKEINGVMFSENELNSAWESLPR